MRKPLRRPGYLKGLGAMPTPGSMMINPSIIMPPITIPGPSIPSPSPTPTPGPAMPSMVMPYPVYSQPYYPPVMQREFLYEAPEPRKADKPKKKDGLIDVLYKWWTQ